MDSSESEISLDVPTEQRLEGIAVSPGIAIATTYLFTQPSPEFFSPSFQTNQETHVSEATIESEIRRFIEALERSDYELKKIAAIAQEKIGTLNAALFEAQSFILKDEMLVQAVQTAIIEEKYSAEYAVKVVMDRYMASLAGSNHAYFRERTQDLRDVKDRIIRNLQHKRLHSKIEEGCIVVAPSLTAADVVLFSQRNIKGCIMSFGGATTHTAIMARALRIPVVVPVGWDFGIFSKGITLILDGYSGEVILNPTAKTLQIYERKLAQLKQLQEAYKDLRLQQAITIDGHAISLQANIEVEQEVLLIQENNAEGVGLLRTEMNFLMHGHALGEDEQFYFYKQILQASAPHPVTIRLLDLGGDKVLPMGQREANPALGWRGIRILLDRPELLIPQLRAVLRASVYGKVRLLIPMVTAVSEVRAVRRLKAKIEQEFRQAEIAFDENIPLGIMVEVPAVAMMAETFAQEADFFSIGTNDLTQYTLAIDRGNDLVGTYYDELHPAVLKLIAQVIEVGNQASLPVSICGEAAANPLAVALFLGLGIKTLSASPIFLPDMKRMVRAIRLSDAQQWAQDALQQSDPRVLKKRILKFMREQGIDTEQFLSFTE